MFALMTNIVQFAYWNVQKKRKKVDGVKASHWYQYRPVYLLMVATVLVLLQPTCMLINGSWICDGSFTTDQLALDSTNSTIMQNATGYYYVEDGSQIGTGYDMDGNFIFTNGFTCADQAKQTFPDGSAYPACIPKGTVYSDGCDPDMQNFFFDGGVTQALVPNTTTGWMIQLFGTYLGFLLMFIGVCQATMLHVKIMKKWADIRKHAN